MLNVVSAVAEEGAGVAAVEAARSIAAEAKVNRLVAAVGAGVVLHSVAAVVVALQSVAALALQLVVALHSVPAWGAALRSIAAVASFAH